jgi:hypothetical protein
MQELSIQISDAPHGLIRVHSSADNGTVHYLKRSDRPHAYIHRLRLEDADTARWNISVRAYTDCILVLLERDLPALAQTVWREEEASIQSAQYTGS